MLTRLVTASALISAALVPAALYAQAASSSPVPRYHLMQLSVDTAAIEPDDFKGRTEAIRSCGQAKDLGQSLGADIKRNRFISATRLPDELKDALEKLPAGHATEVFSADGKVMRVLVLCNRA